MRGGSSDENIHVFVRVDSNSNDARAADCSSVYVVGDANGRRQMKIAELYSDKTKWTQGSIARNPKGIARALWNADDACCWCLMGALQKCYPEIEQARKTFCQIENKVGNIFKWNDNPKRTFSEVKALVEELGI